MDSAGEITIELVPNATDELRALISELDQTFAAAYSPEQRHGLALDAIFKPDIRFFFGAVERHGRRVWWGGLFYRLRRSKADVCP